MRRIMNRADFLDAGRADAIVLSLESAEGKKTVVIDGGTKYYNGKTVLVDFLEQQGVKRIDLLILTHLHQDHFGGFYHLIDRLEIDQAVIPYGDIVFHPLVRGLFKSHEYFEEYHEFYQYLVRSNVHILHPQDCAGRTFRFGACELSCLYPLNGTVLEQEPYIERLCSSDLSLPEAEACCERFRALCNEQSNIWMLAQNGQDKILFCADCTAETMDAALSARPGNPEIVKLSHHGINTRYFSAEQLKKLAPKTIVISNNRELYETVQQDAVPLMPCGADIRYTFEGTYTVEF